MAKKNEDIGGVWRTIGGRRVFIKDGQDLATAMKESGKFKGTTKSGTKYEFETKEEYNEFKKMQEGKGEYKNLSYSQKQNRLMENLEKLKEESEFYKKLSNKDKEEYDNYLKEGYTKNDIENTLMYKTPEERMREAGIKFASDEEAKDLQSKANEVAKGLKEENKYDNMSNYEIYDKADALARETKDYELKDKINKKLDSIDRANKKGEGYADKQTNELRKILAEQENTNNKKIGNDYLPKETKIETQGKSNRAEVSNNIQAHILSYYDNPVDFMEQMDNMDYYPTKWHAGQEMAKGGSYAIYYDDQRKFLNDLKINPKGKQFSDDRVFETYTSLIGRESEKLYNRLEKLYNQYKAEHKNSDVSLDDFRKWFK